MNAIERLLERVNRIEPNANGCRIWEGAVDRDGYARTTLKENGQRIRGTARVHRRVLGAKVGRTLTPSEQACHTCDIPGCVEASHLWVGSARDNTRDAINKGRIDPVAVGRRMAAIVVAQNKQVRGDQHGRRKLSSADVVVILQLLADGELYRVIADQFGVTGGTITLIAAGKNWKSVPRPDDLHERRALVKLAQVRDWHGTQSGYTYHGCRCAPCTAKNTANHRAYRESKRAS